MQVLLQYLNSVSTAKLLTFRTLSIDKELATDKFYYYC